MKFYSICLLCLVLSASALPALGTQKEVEPENAAIFEDLTGKCLNLLADTNDDFQSSDSYGKCFNVDCWKPNGDKGICLWDCVAKKCVNGCE